MIRRPRYLPLRILGTWMACWAAFLLPSLWYLNLPWRAASLGPRLLAEVLLGVLVVGGSTRLLYLLFRGKGRVERFAVGLAAYGQLGLSAVLLTAKCSLTRPYFDDGLWPFIAVAASLPEVVFWNVVQGSQAALQRYAVTGWLTLDLLAFGGLQALKVSVPYFLVRLMSARTRIGLLHA